jgi:hypothetical protein
MTLLHSIMLSPSFAEAVNHQQRAIEVFFDSALYTRNPETSEEPDWIGGDNTRFGMFKGAGNQNQWKAVA